ncbi:hypothetical protein D3C86_1254700 [compost metagenome]
MAVHTGELFEFFLIELFKKVTSFIIKNCWFDDVAIFEWCFFYFHNLLKFLKIYIEFTLLLWQIHICYFKLIVAF